MPAPVVRENVTFSKIPASGGSVYTPLYSKTKERKGYVPFKATIKRLNPEHMIKDWLMAELWTEFLNSKPSVESTAEGHGTNSKSGGLGNPQVSKSPVNADHPAPSNSSGVKDNLRSISPSSHTPHPPEPFGLPRRRSHSPGDSELPNTKESVAAQRHGRTPSPFEPDPYNTDEELAKAQREGRSRFPVRPSTEQVRSGNKKAPMNSGGSADYYTHSNNGKVEDKNFVHNPMSLQEMHRMNDSRPRQLAPPPSDDDDWRPKFRDHSNEIWASSSKPMGNRSPTYGFDPVRELKCNPAAANPKFEDYHPDVQKLPYVRRMYGVEDCDDDEANSKSQDLPDSKGKHAGEDTDDDEAKLENQVLSVSERKHAGEDINDDEEASSESQLPPVSKRKHSEEDADDAEADLKRKKLNDRIFRRIF